MLGLPPELEYKLFVIGIKVGMFILLGIATWIMLWIATHENPEV